MYHQYHEVQVVKTFYKNTMIFLYLHQTSPNQNQLQTYNTIASPKLHPPRAEINQDTYAQADEKVLHQCPDRRQIFPPGLCGGARSGPRSNAFLGLSAGSRFQQHPQPKNGGGHPRRSQPVRLFPDQKGFHVIQPGRNFVPLAGLK